MTEEAKLWCVHVTGADDVHPMPSRAEALEEANALNMVICRATHEEGDPVLWAIVTEWPYTPESHAASVAIRAEALRTRAAAAIQEAKEGV